MKHLIPALLDALALVIPTQCAVCGAPDRAVCAVCARELVPAVTSLSIQSTEGPPLAVWAALPYAGAAKQALSALKEHGRTDVASGLGRTLGAAVDVFPRGVEFTVAPSSRTAYRKRGYHPVELLAARAGPRIVRTLRVARHVSDQAGLGVAGRRANLEGSFAGLRRFPEKTLCGRSFVIIDDVVTSGATLLECRRALEHAGARVVGAATLAFAERRTGASSVERADIVERWVRHPGAREVNVQ